MQLSRMSQERFELNCSDRVLGVNSAWAAIEYFIVVYLDDLPMKEVIVATTIKITT